MVPDILMRDIFDFGVYIYLRNASTTVVLPLGAWLCWNCLTLHYTVRLCAVRAWWNFLGTATFHVLQY